MCGFAGFIESSNHAADAQQTMDAMLNSIVHRGPDDRGFWHDEQIVLGHCRLAIVDLTSCGHQPMLSHCERWVLAFNGEIYNHKSLRQTLEKEKGSLSWRGHSDTEVFLAAIATYGIDAALEQSVGMFAFALWDRQEKTLFLARDRLGEKPLYYGWLGNTFVFASELAAFYRHPKWQGEINRDALALFMRHNYIPAPYSIFSNVEKIQPGKILAFSAAIKKTTMRTYWSIATMLQENRIPAFEGSAQQAVDQLDVLMRQSISEQMLADVPLGAFLSGGIDSSTVVAFMQSLSAVPIRTFTIGFYEAGYNEAEHARAIAQHLGTQHTELYVSPQDALNVIPNLPHLYSEPFSDSSQIPTFLVAQLAKQSVSVSLSGDGGDELFCGYSRYMLFEKLWPYLSFIPRPLRPWCVALIKALPASVWNTILSSVLRFVHQRHRYANPGDKLHKLAELLTLKSKEGVYQHLVSHWKTPSNLVLDAKEPLTMLTGLEESPEFSNFTRQIMYLDKISYLPDDILVKVDRAAMGVSLETRVPILDHRLVAFSMSLPLDILRYDGQSKWPLRQLLHRYVPQHLIERPKMGFGVPIGAWMRGPLREWCEDLLEPRRIASQGFLNTETVSTVWRQHQTGERDWPYLLWDVLMFQAWLERYSTYGIR